MFTSPSHRDPDAAEEFSKLLRAYGDMAYRMAFQITGGREAEAADLVQEVFLKIWRQWSAPRPTSMKGWMYRVLQNLYFDSLRKQARHPADSLELLRGETTTLGDGLADGNATLQSSLEQEETSSQVADALAGLENDFRLPVMLCDMEGLPYEDISRILSVPIGTVRSRIHRGRLQLRRVLKKSNSLEVSS